jgi:hypothetical protein
LPCVRGRVSAMPRKANPQRDKGGLQRRAGLRIRGLTTSSFVPARAALVWQSKTRTAVAIRGTGHFGRGRSAGLPSESRGALVIVQQEPAPLLRQLLRSCRNCWLHYIFHNVFTDLTPHLRPNTGRGAVMESGPDACICNQA